jgi:hypothetical protein
MFIETHQHELPDKSSYVDLTFLRSLDVQVFPCGRRRSTEFTTADNTSCYIPFDPEARLNTEANNRKASSINGFNNTYVCEYKSKSDTLTMALAGYLFNIKIKKDYQTLNSICDEILKALKVTSSEAIYANIRIAQVPLYSSDVVVDYETSVLSAQAAPGDTKSTSLDLLKSYDANGQTPSFDSDNFYFSGISFSIDSVAKLEATKAKNVAKLISYDAYDIYNAEAQNDQVISLCIFKNLKDGEQDNWQLNQKALLPKIAHGDTEDSVSVANLQAVSIDTPLLKQAGNAVPIIKIDNGQLQIFNVIK